MTKDEALKLALEALDCIYSPLHVREIEKVGNAMKIIKEALAQPEQEPVAWVTGWHDGRCVIRAANHAAILPIGIALYTAPPRREWVGLTGEEIADLTLAYAGYPVRLTEAIEAKLKEKNA